jgi:hypothetical protein
MITSGFVVGTSKKPKAPSATTPVCSCETILLLFCEENEI